MAAFVWAGDPAPPGRANFDPPALLHLFNGTNLAGWHTWLVDTRRHDPRHVFGVTNGMIHISGDGLGYLGSDEEFEDYLLKVQFKWGRTNTTWGDRIGRARDSGIFLHATGPDGNSVDGHGAFQAALECQVMQGAVGDVLLIRGHAADGSGIAPRLRVEAAPVVDSDGWPQWREGGAPRTLVGWGRVNWAGKARDWFDRTDFRGLHDVESRVDEWTTVECESFAGTISIRVNGQRVNEVREVLPRHGRILLQCEGSEIFFRQVDLRPHPSRRGAAARR